MNHAVKFGMLALLAALAALYFGWFLVNSASLVDVLLRRGWGNRGWTRERLKAAIATIGSVGFVVSMLAVVFALTRAMG